MSKAVFITGTGTDVGKTYITGLIVKKLAAAGKHPAYYKAAMSGNARRADGSLIPGDAMFVQQFSGIPQPLEEMCPYVYEHAWSPHLASRVEGHPVDMAVVRQGYLELADAGLGTINSVVLTVEYMKAHALPLKGIIFNHYHTGDTMKEDNIAMCRQMTGLPVLATVRDDAEDIDIDPEVLAGLYDDIRLA